MAELSADALAQTFAPIAPVAPSQTPPATVPQATSPAQSTGGISVATAGPAPRDISALPAIASAMEYTESRGQNVVSPKGARGPRQIEPGTFATFAAPGQKIDNESDNRVVGDKILTHLFDKYGSWDKALVAYNWGEGNADKWIARGADPTKLPAETRAYVPQVLSRAGLGTQAGAAIVAGKRELSPDDLAHGMTVGTEPEPTTGATGISPGTTPITPGISYNFDPMAMGIDATDPAQVKELVDTHNAVGAGIIKGLKNVVVGGAQAMAPALASGPITVINNQLDAPLNRAIDMHPVLGGAGEAIGTTVGVLMGGGALGAAKEALPATMKSLIDAFGARMGIVGRGTAAGAVSGALSYNADPEHTSRVAETVLGGMFGALGGTIGKALIGAGRTMADQGAYNGFVSLLKGNVASLTPSTSALRDSFVGHYTALEATKAAKYTLRNAAGREIEGFDYDSMAATPRAAITGTREAGVAPTPTTRTVATQVDRELGGDEQRAARARYDAAVAQHERAVANLPPILGIKPGDERYADLARRVEIETAPPPEYVPIPVASDQFSSAIQTVNRAILRAKSDPTTRTQLGKIKAGLMNAASDQARDLGMDVGTFLRRSAEAAKFMREEIGPVRDAFQGRTPAQITDPLNARAITPTQMYDRAVKIIEGGDTQALTKFAKIVGPRGREDLVKIAAFRALTADTSKGVAGMRDYLREHAENLQVLLGRDGAQELRGYANIADRLARPANSSTLERLFKKSHGVATSIGLYEIARGTLHGVTGGSFAPVAEGAMMISAPIMLHGIGHVLMKLGSVPGMLPLVRRIGKMRPESSEMQAAIKEVERRFVRASAVTGQVLGTPTGQAVSPAVQGVAGMFARRAVTGVAPQMAHPARAFGADVAPGPCCYA